MKSLSMDPSKKISKGQLTIPTNKARIPRHCNGTTLAVNFSRQTPGAVGACPTKPTKNEVLNSSNNSLHQKDAHCHPAVSVTNGAGRMVASIA